MNFTIETIDQVAAQVVSQIANRKVVCFYGSMGAGKTTLIKSICKVLGVNDVVASPTFALVNEYRDSIGNPIFHFDFYRINKIEEVYDFGYEEYFYNSPGLCLVEWPELIEDIIPDDAVRINISVNSDLSRDLEILL